MLFLTPEKEKKVNRKNYTTNNPAFQRARSYDLRGGVYDFGFFRAISRKREREALPAGQKSIKNEMVNKKTEYPIKKRNEAQK